MRRWRLKNKKLHWIPPSSVWELWFHLEMDSCSAARFQMYNPIFSLLPLCCGTCAPTWPGPGSDPVAVVSPEQREAEQEEGSDSREEGQDSPITCGDDIHLYDNQISPGPGGYRMGWGGGRARNEVWAAGSVQAPLAGADLTDGSSAAGADGGFDPRESMGACCRGNDHVTGAGCPDIVTQASDEKLEEEK